jgi:protein-disulfide isomerase
VLVTFKNFPLTSIHERAANAGAAALCAARQRRFWAFHDSMFGGRAAVPMDLRDMLIQVGLDGPSAEACLDDPETRGGLARDLSEGRSAGIASTPSFLLGYVKAQGVYVTRKIVGAQPYSVFETALDDLLRRQGPS